jgi:hypothetical protein
MIKKQNTYINTELDWCEKKLEEWKKYIDDNPINILKDRIIKKQTAKGSISIISATVESQIKSIRDTMKEYLQLLEVVNNLREKEEAKKEARGNTEVPPRMQ